MKRARIESPESVLLEEYDAQGPDKDEVSLDVKYCGICGSDVHAFHGKHPFIDLPVTPGHEIGAVISEVGSKANNYEKGQRVTLIPQLTCGKCYNCRQDRYNICKNLKVIGAQTDGAMAETINVPAELVVPLPDDFDLEKAAMIEPLAVATHAVKILDDVKDKNIVVLGAGTIGLLIMQVLKAFKAPNVMISDVLDRRLELAEDLGVDYTLNPKKEDMTQGLLRDKFGDRGAGVFIEAVGVEETIRQAIALLRKGGKIVVVGVFGEDAEVQMGLVQDREINLEGSLMYLKEDFEDAIDLIREGSVEVSPLVSKAYGISEIEKAFERAANDLAGPPKTMVDIEK